MQYVKHITSINNSDFDVDIKISDEHTIITITFKLDYLTVKGFSDFLYFSVLTDVDTNLTREAEATLVLKNNAGDTILSLELKTNRHDEHMLNPEKFLQYFTDKIALIK